MDSSFRESGLMETILQRQDEYINCVLISYTNGVAGWMAPPLVLSIIIRMPEDRCFRWTKGQGYPGAAQTMDSH